MSSLSDSEPNAISTAAVSMRIVQDGDKADGEPLLEAAAVALMSHIEVVPPAAVAVDASTRKISTRKPIVLLDASGQERTFGSALGALTRKFVDIIQVRTRASTSFTELSVIILSSLTHPSISFPYQTISNVIQASQSGSVDMNETATYLNVPKRRIYDITNVLEGVGVGGLPHN